MIFEDNAKKLFNLEVPQAKGVSGHEIRTLCVGIVA